MSSANNKEYGELEQSMWRRFQDAEAMPDPEVWSRIDHELTLLENAKYKRRVLFYRQLAAACFVLFILAGSALVMHFKQDKDQALLATTGTSNSTTNPTINDTNTSIASNQTIAEDQTAQEATIAQGYTSDKAQLQTIAQAEVENYSYDRNYSSADKATIPGRSQKYTSATADPATITTQPGAYTSGQLANSTIANSTIDSPTIGNPTIAATLTDQLVQSYMPASQAIASVPADYTGSSALNPLIRRNATLGTIEPETKAEESITLQKQADFALALNSPTETEKQETTKTNSRWNVGMGVTSSSFAQKVDIPEQYLVASNGRIGILVHTGPIVSTETQNNLVDAYEEFDENTEAARSVNVDAKAGLRLGKRFKLLAGLGYSKNTARTRTSYIVEQFVFNPRTDERTKLKPSTIFIPALETFTTDSVSVVKTKDPFTVEYSYQMLSLPVALQVEGKLGQKWFWYAHGGGAANLLMQSTIKADNPEIASISYGPTDDSPFKKVQFTGNVGLGLGKKLSNAFSVSVGPEYRHFFSPLLANEYADTNQGKPYAFGVNMGINYMLDHGSK